MKTRSKTVRSCPCHSGLSYRQCCRPYHKGHPAPDAERLMRSRYAAYALNLGRYIIDTTDSTHPDHSRPAREWITDIRSFSDKTLFKDLEILEKDLGKDIATVTFRAHLLQDGKDVSFTERSRFRKAGKRWVYCDGEFLH